MDRQEARQNRPYGLELVTDSDLFEYTDTRNDAATVARWQPVLQQLGIEVLEIADIPSRPILITVDSVEWEVRPLSPDRVEQVPADVYARIQAAKTSGVPFAYWLWGEERFMEPTFTPLPQTQTEPKTDRLLGFGRRKTQDLQDWWTKVDPILIAVIPTAPNRGVWCKLGAWFH